MTVKVMLLVPLLPSVRLALAIDRVGIGSSSVIVTVTCWEPLSVAPPPPVTPVMSRITVSLASFSVSCTAVMVAVPVVLPAVIVMVVEDRV